MTEEIQGTAPDEPGTNRSFVLLAPGTIASDYALQSLNKALGEAQNEFEPAFKGEENKFIGYKYVPLEAIIAAVRPSLTKYHLTVSQFPVTDLEMKTISLYTRLVHWDSGEWLQNELVLPAELALGKDGAPKFNQQTIGGSQTYAQKYAYKAILGVPDSEEMIDSTEDKGDLPPRKSQATVKADAQRRASAISQSESPRTASGASQGAQPSSQRPAAAPATAQGHAGQLVFEAPDLLTTVIKGVQPLSKEKLDALPKGKNPWLTVTFLGTHNGVSFASCFATHLWEILKESIGLECQFRIAERDKDKAHYINIVDILAVDGQPVQIESAQ